MTATPQRIGRYRVQEVIGAGGFATVYRATDDRLAIDVAIKVLAENHSLDADARERFIEEGRRLRRVRGAHFLAVHDMGDTERAQPYLVLEWADRGDLSRRVAMARQQGRPPGPQDALEVARALAEALGELHRHQLVHRDVAPRNLLLGSRTPAGRSGAATGGMSPTGRSVRLIADDERLLMADLGLSKDLAVASGITVATGTSGFAPPEQRAHGGVVDHRADQWAASALVVWLALDHPPDDAGRWRRELVAAGWPRELASVLARGLARSPDHRFPSVDEWFAALAAALEPARPRPVRSRSDGPDRWRRRGAWLTRLIVVALVAGMGVGVAATRERGGPTVRTEPRRDGGQRTIVEDDGVTITLDGPRAVAIGQPVRFSVEVDGAESWIWVGPDGVVAAGTDTFELGARSPGRATVRVLAVNDRGEIVEATRRVTVSR